MVEIGKEKSHHSTEWIPNRIAWLKIFLLKCIQVICAYFCGGDTPESKNSTIITFIQLRPTGKCVNTRDLTALQSTTQNKWIVHSE